MIKTRFYYLITGLRTGNRFTKQRNPNGGKIRDKRLVKDRLYFCAPTEA
jgi:hypothetical protein